MQLGRSGISGGADIFEQVVEVGLLLLFFDPVLLQKLLDFLVAQRILVRFHLFVFLMHLVQLRLDSPDLTLHILAVDVRLLFVQGFLLLCLVNLLLELGALFLQLVLFDGLGLQLLLQILDLLPELRLHGFVCRRRHLVGITQELVDLRLQRFSDNVEIVLFTPQLVFQHPDFFIQLRDLLIGNSLIQLKELPWYHAIRIPVKTVLVMRFFILLDLQWQIQIIHRHFIKIKILIPTIFNLSYK